VNKAVIIGIIIVAVIGIGIISSMSSTEKIEEQVSLSEEEIILDEIESSSEEDLEVVVEDLEVIIEEDLEVVEEDLEVSEEDLEEESETTGKSISVDLEESMKFKTP